MEHHLAILFQQLAHMFQQFQTIRQDAVVSIDTRGVVAMSGSFGYELDLGKVSEAEKNTDKGQIKNI